MTQTPITHVDLYPDFSVMTVADLETLSDQAFTQLEEGPLVEGLLGFYLSLTTEIDHRRAREVPGPDANLPDGARPGTTGSGEQILQAAG